MLLLCFRHQVTNPRPPLSPLRVISRQDSSSVPSSPVPSSDTTIVWPVARPRPQRLGSPPGAETQEDQEVLQIVSQGMCGEGQELQVGCLFVYLLINLFLDKF